MKIQTDIITFCVSKLYFLNLHFVLLILIIVFVLFMKIQTDNITFCVIKPYFINLQMFL